MGVRSFGRGGATTFQQDLQNADCIVIEGSNMAECHPVGFQWVMEAKARGATLIHVDPRFTRTSALADLHVPLRAGTDIAFLGGIINYVLANDKYVREYVLTYTNAATLVSENFADTEDADGLFSGFDPEQHSYDTRTWPFLFAGSGMMAAGGLGLVTAGLPGSGPGEARPAGNLALLGTAMELAASERMERRIGMVAEPCSEGRGGRYMKAGKALAVLGAAGAMLSRRSRVATAVSGAALVAASAATRWAIYHAGMASASDPKYTVVPQRQRLNDRAREEAS